MPNAVLALNAGSSSIKFALFEIDAGDMPRRILHGMIEGIGTAPHFIAKDADNAVIGERRWTAAEKSGHAAVLGDLLAFVDDHLGADDLIAVGHRVVHGGRDFAGPARLDEASIAALDRLTPLAPLHQPHCLAPVRALMALRPDLAQIACFDTAFHHTLPAVATRFALPRAYEAAGIRRYGFHGLSYEYIARTLGRTAPELAEGRVVVAHLGNGSSLCALQGGRSVDTTMGFTALDGLMMGTRCGALDPGVILHMLKDGGLDAAAIEDVLYHRSGLLGVSGISSDMRVLLDSDDPRAREATELYAFRIARETAAMAASMGGLDGIVFTAGIGEHAPPIRAATCARLAWLGVAIDPAANARGTGRIATAESRVDVRVIPTDEEAMIVRHTLETLGAAA